MWGWEVAPVLRVTIRLGLTERRPLSKDLEVSEVTLWTGARQSQQPLEVSVHDALGVLETGQLCGRSR